MKVLLAVTSNHKQAHDNHGAHCGALLGYTADDFPRKKERSDGLDSYCKVCNCAATAQRVQRKGPVPGIASKVHAHPFRTL